MERRREVIREASKPKRRATRNGRTPKVEHVRLSDVRPSPENDQLYRPVDLKDPEIVALARSICQQGLLEPLVVTLDDYILSGHRRYAAAKLADLETVPCRRVALRRCVDPNEFLRLLREHNRQREKTNGERLREELIGVDADDAHEALYEYRRAQAAVDAKPLRIRGKVRRKAISSAKRPMLRAVQEIIESRRRFWPLSDRQVHYALLNARPLKHASKPGSVYGNDLASYKSLVDLLTRARLEGSIPFAAVQDETRPVQIWDVHQNPRSFVRGELENMFRGYWRDLMQSQPNHIEIVGEKNTVGSILKPVAADYTIPLTTGRGYCSLPPRHAMAERFQKSGKEKLVLLIVSDLDPDGEEIAHSFARSMRDDFGIAAVHPIKVALTAEQVERFELPPVMQAKAAKNKSTATKRAKFVDFHGEDVFELEALPPEALQQIVREGIEAVIDPGALSGEIAAERQDAAFLEGVRRTVAETLSGLDLDHGDY
jgi:ParB-like chromosome segregation protein Spo0J